MLLIAPYLTSLSPLLSPTQTIAACGIFTSGYVGSLYLFQATRISQLRGTTRNHPDVIKARLCSVGITTSLSLVGVWGILRSKGVFASLVSIVAELLGLSLPCSFSTAAHLIIAPLCITATLFLGPLYSAWLDSTLPGQKYFSFKDDVLSRLFSLEGFRDYIAGPISEEIVFRSCVVAVSLLGGQSPAKIIFLSPLYFGIAHVHHIWEVYVGNGKTKDALILGSLQSAFQFTYTTLFGWYATFLQMRTGSFIPSVLSHTFCNITGLPQPQESISNHPNRKTAILSAYTLGIIGFAKLLWPLTSPHLYGGSVLWSQ